MKHSSLMMWDVISEPVSEPRWSPEHNPSPAYGCGGQTQNNAIMSIDRCLLWEPYTTRASAMLTPRWPQCPVLQHFKDPKYHCTCVWYCLIAKGKKLKLGQVVVCSNIVQNHSSSLHRESYLVTIYPNSHEKLTKSEIRSSWSRFEHCSKSLI